MGLWCDGRRCRQELVGKFGADSAGEEQAVNP